MRIKGIAILLICLILVLSLMDAPEYIHCIHIDLCEFLELHAHLDNVLKSDHIKHISYTPGNNFFLMLEDIITNREFVNITIPSYVPLILMSVKTSCDLKNKENLVLTNIAHASLLIQNRLTAQTLELIKISVIRS